MKQWLLEKTSGSESLSGRPEEGPLGTDRSGTPLYCTSTV